MASGASGEYAGKRHPQQSLMKASMSFRAQVLECDRGHTANPAIAQHCARRPNNRGAVAVASVRAQGGAPSAGPGTGMQGDAQPVRRVSPGAAHRCRAWRLRATCHSCEHDGQRGKLLV
jgi:hypothetical protein